MQKILRLLSKSTILITSLSFLLFTACQREIDDPGGITPPTGGVDDNITVVAGVRGVVVDENSQPVAGATVTSGTNSTTTDRYGVFRFNNINLSKANGYVKVTKTGYFTGSRTFVTTAGRIHNVRIRLLPKTTTGTFAASAGGTVTLGTGGKLVMPANAITDASGAAYTGTVNIAMTWIDPTAPNLPEIVVGDLRGITTDGQERGLETFGMLGVEMTGAGGQTLKIAAGKTAELTFPVPAAILANAPATIDLWHFDETKGRWIQEGTAAKTGSNYIAQVSHFSFWNCDAPFPLVDLCMTLQNAANNQPLNNVQVRIVRQNGSYGTGWTDSLGNVCGKVPKNELLILQVMNLCNGLAYTQNIGPFSSNTSLPPISVSLAGPNSLVVSGILTNCSNSNVTNGAVVVYTNNGNSFSVPVANGNFSFILISCGSTPISFSVTGIDLATQKQSVMYNGSAVSGSVNVGTLQACGSLDEYIEYIINGVPVNWFDLGNPNTITPYDSVSHIGYVTQTSVYGQWVVNNNVEATYFWFNHNETPGSYPLKVGVVDINNNAGTYNLKHYVSSNPTINITSIGPAGTGYIEGNFTEQLQGFNGTGPIFNVICHFRVKR
ncbi:MAG: carboxypeptidase regulatory-like domain-containing protein [Chitinophagaceae bacterium]|nr:carboxypeptidase regulatory-like domain-containing protein [Chitinophagaceae bacterium]